MIITYSQGEPSNIVYGKGWEARRWRKTQDMEIVAILWQTIIANQKLVDYYELTELIKETYKNKIVKSTIDIYYNEKEIEIIKKGVFPNIMVFKN